MPNGYSNDLRERVLAYKDNNHTQVETCEVFGISRSTLNAWLKLRRETGSAHLRPRPTRRRNRKIDEGKLKAYIAQHPDAYLREIAAVFGVSASAIMYACQRLGITRKKRRPATPNVMKLNAQPFNKN
jgi:putative transposase